MLDYLRQYLDALEGEAIPQLSVNCVIMAFHDRRLKVVVNQITDGKIDFMVIPGGYIKQQEDLSESVERIVRECTGLKDMLFRQFAVFGKASRSFANEPALKGALQSESDEFVSKWLSNRFISLCYIALVDFRSIELKPTEFYDSARWLSIDQAEKLALDHADILGSAREFLLKEMPHAPIASNLLPNEFTLPDLHALMESILNRNIDRPNFRRKILGTGMLEKTGLDNTGKGRPADIYRFKHGKNTTLMDEFNFGF